MRYYVEIRLGASDAWSRSTTYGGEYRASELKCLRARIRKEGISGAEYRIRGSFTHSTIKP